LHSYILAFYFRDTTNYNVVYIIYIKDVAIAK